MNRRTVIKRLVATLASIFSLSWLKKPVEQRIFHCRENGILKYAWFTSDGRKRTSPIFHDVNDVLLHRLHLKDWNKVTPSPWTEKQQDQDDSVKFDKNWEFDGVNALEWPGSLEGGEVPPKWVEKNKNLTDLGWNYLKREGFLLPNNPFLKKDTPLT